MSPRVNLRRWERETRTPRRTARRQRQWSVSVCVLQELVEYYQCHSLKESFKQLDTTLKYPYKARERAASRASSRSPGNARTRRHPRAHPEVPPPSHFPLPRPLLPTCPRERLPVCCTDLGQEPLPDPHPQEQWAMVPPPDTSTLWARVPWWSHVLSGEC